MNKLRIAFVIPSFYPATVYGGPLVSGRETAKGLAALGHDVRVLTTNANGKSPMDVPKDRDVEVDPGVRVRYFPKRFGEDVAPALVRALSAAVQDADVVHLTAVYSFTTLPTLLTAKRFGKPVVWSPRGSLQSWSTNRRAKLKGGFIAACRLAAPKRLALHVTSSEEAADARALFPRATIAQIPNGVHIPRARNPTPRAEALRLLFVGRLHPVKGLENLMDACAGLHLPFTLTLVGAGDAEYVKTLHQRAETLGIASRVRFAGHASSEELSAYYDTHDLVVAPSHTENFGLAIAEGLAGGVPVLASTGTPWSRIRDVGCGDWVSNDAEPLRGALNRLAERDLVEAGARGRKWMTDEFSWESACHQLERVYRDLLGAP